LQKAQKKSTVQPILKKYLKNTMNNFELKSQTENELSSLQAVIEKLFDKKISEIFDADRNLKPEYAQPLEESGEDGAKLKTMYETRVALFQGITNGIATADITTLANNVQYRDQGEFAEEVIKFANIEKIHKGIRSQQKKLLPGLLITTASILSRQNVIQENPAEVITANITEALQNPKNNNPKINWKDWGKLGPKKTKVSKKAASIETLNMIEDADEYIKTMKTLIPALKEVKKPKKYSPFKNNPEKEAQYIEANRIAIQGFQKNENLSSAQISELLALVNALDESAVTDFPRKQAFIKDFKDKMNELYDPDFLDKIRGIDLKPAQEGLDKMAGASNKAGFNPKYNNNISAVETAINQVEALSALSDHEKTLVRDLITKIDAVLAKANSFDSTSALETKKDNLNNLKTKLQSKL
jgi:hypothetical protein